MLWSYSQLSPGDVQGLYQNDSGAQPQLRTYYGQAGVNTSDMVAIRCRPTAAPELGQWCLGFLQWKQLWQISAYGEGLEADPQRLVEN